MKLRLQRLLLMSIATLGTDAGAAVRIYRPESASQIVLKLDEQPASAASLQLIQLKQAAAIDAAALPSYVEALLEASAASGSERYYRDAEQAIQNAPTELQPLLAVPRAKILQHRHEFRAAELALAPVIQHNPRDLDARLLRAQIRIHLLDGQGAMQDCVALTPLVDILTSSICIAQARAALGDLERAYAMVTTMLQSQQGTPPVRSWGAGVAAEIAARLGDTKNAEQWYRTAFELDPNTHYPRVAYAGWLRSQGRLAAARDIEKAPR